MMSSLQELQEKLANLQKLPAMGLSPSPLPPPTMDKEMMKTMMRTMMKEILEEMAINQSQNQSQNPIPDQIPTKEDTLPKLTIQDAICSSLDKEEQTWLCQDKVILGIPQFLTSSEGKELVKLFISSYREYSNDNHT